ncbi:BON domain-containing protein [Thermosulfuriphilus sp.]
MISTTGLKIYIFLPLLGILLLLNSCGPVIVGTGAAGAYKVATDERSLGRQVDDATITARIKAALAQDPQTKARKIDVDTVDGTVTLTGLVSSQAEAKRAIEIARSTPGVRGVRNNLQIGKRSLGRLLDDKTLGAKIKAKLLVEPGVRSLSIDVDVVNGVVTLTGVVKDKDQMDRILAIAKGTEGVRAVVNNLRLKR